MYLKLITCLIFSFLLLFLLSVIFIGHWDLIGPIYTISGRIVIDVVTYIIFIILLSIKILYSKLLLYAMLTVS